MAWFTETTTIQWQHNILKFITADYTVTKSDVDLWCVIMVNSTSWNIVVTLPKASSFDADIRKKIIINHTTWDNKLKVLLSWSDEFIYTNTYFYLPMKWSSTTFWTLNHWGSATRGIVSDVTIKASWHRDADWASTNFSSNTVIPFDGEAYNTQDEILVYTSWANARYTVKTAWSYKVSFMIDIDSTWWSTWNALAQVYKNWVAIESLQARTGNYANEDQSMACMPAYIDLDVDDYIDLRIDQNNLTWNLVHAMMNIEITL